MSITNKRVAVLLAAYNGSHWIEAQLESIQAQRDVDVYIFISVDESTDGTEEWCSNYCNAHKNAYLVPAEGKPAGASRNFFNLIRKVDIHNYDMVALADQDDVWNVDKLSRASHELVASGSHCYSSNVTAMWPDGKTALLDKAQRQVRFDHYFEAAGPGCTYVFGQLFANYLQIHTHKNRAELEDISLHDWYIYALARSNRFIWYIDPRPSMLYRQHSNNQVGANVGLTSFILRYKRIRNGWWFRQIRKIEALVNETLPSSERPEWRELTRIDLVSLSLQSADCRRRARDKFLFSAICILAAIMGLPK
jgi:rhamnosyltransferase